MKSISASHSFHEAVVQVQRLVVAHGNSRGSGDILLQSSPHLSFLNRIRISWTSTTHAAVCVSWGGKPEKDSQVDWLNRVFILRELLYSLASLVSSVFCCLSFICSFLWWWIKVDQTWLDWIGKGLKVLRIYLYCNVKSHNLTKLLLYFIMKSKHTKDTTTSSCGTYIWCCRRWYF